MFDLYKGDTSSGYRQKYRELAMNLRDPLNPDINSALLCGAWQPETVVGMSVKELASSSLKAQREAEAKWAREEARSDLGKLNGLTDMFRCGKCRERKCTYYQMQTRSADEPMTVFVRCTVCGNRWKVSSSRSSTATGSRSPRTRRSAAHAADLIRCADVSNSLPSLSPLSTVRASKALAAASPRASFSLLGRCRLRVSTER